MKVNVVKIKLDISSTSCKTANIGYTRNTAYNSILEIYTNEKKEFIVGLFNNSKTVSEGDFGSYTRDNYTGILYIAKNQEDYLKALKVFKTGNIPKGSFENVIMTNYSEETYYKNNDCSMTIYVCYKPDYIKDCMEHNNIPLNFYYADWFEFDDGSHIELDCNLYTNTFCSVKEFRNFIRTDDRVKFLWKKLEIDDRLGISSYNEKYPSSNMLNDCSGDGDTIGMKFRDVLISSFKRLKFSNENFSIQETINRNKRKIEANENAEIEYKKRCEESNAKYQQRYDGEKFLTDNQKETITVSELVGNENDPALIKELNKLRLDFYNFEPLKTNTSKSEIIKSLIDVINNPSDSVDIDYVLASLKLMGEFYERNNRECVNNNDDLKQIIIAAEQDFKLPNNSLISLLNLPLRTSLQCVSAIS